MHVIRARSALSWGALDLPLFGLTSDWYGNLLEPPATFCLAVDERHFWFVAGHGATAQLHPSARPGRFLAGLWEHDVAELFLADPRSGRYLELNLAPNGSWWSCEFTAPRQRAEEIDIAMPEVATFSELAPNGGWLAAMAIPLDLLRARIDFGGTTRANVAFILGSPAQRFLSAANLGDGEPDFHRPDRFKTVQFADLPE